MDKKESLQKQIECYANLPYTVSVEPQDDGKGVYYIAKMVELPDLFMTGDTREEAITELEAVKRDWIAEYLKLGNKMPMPLKSRNYSGKIIVRMPLSLHEALALKSESEEVSLNQYMVTALARAVGYAEPKKKRKNKIPTKELLMVKEAKQWYHHK